MPALSIPTPQVCQTPICIQTAETIKKDMNFNIDPCSDFYQYSCGGWIKDHELPPDRSTTGILSDIQYNNDEIVYNLLKGTYDDFTRKVLEDARPLLIEQATDRNNFNLVQDFYNACMDEATLTQLGPSPIYSSLVQLKAKTELTDTLVFLFMKTEEPFFNTYIGPDSKNPTVNIISIDQPGLGAPSVQYYQDKAIMMKYRRGLIALMESVVGLTVNDKSIMESKRVNFKLMTTVEIETSVDQFIKMETILSTLLVKQEIHNNPTLGYNPRHLEDLQVMCPFIDWRRFFRQLIPKDSAVPDTFIVATVSYFDKLAQWFRTSQDNTTDFLKNYFMVRYIFSKSSQLDPKTSDLNNAITNGIFNGVHTNPPRWRHCLSSTTLTFGSMLSRYYVMVKFGGENKRKRVLDFLTLIHQSWEIRLKTLDWLDPPTLEMALDKLSKIMQQAAYGVQEPDIRSPSSLQSYYRGLKVDKHTYFINVDNSNTWFINYAWNQLTKPVIKAKFDMNSYDANAYYSAFENEVVVSSGIMASPFYDDQVPAYLNFAGLGLVVAHEITHAFDNMGRLYNGNGILDDWWTQATADRFTEKTKCFVDQYGNFTTKDSVGKVYHINGNMTLGENLADNGGFAVTRNAYKEFAKTTPQQKLPYLNLTPDQLFFVNYARAWCGKMAPEYEVSLVLSDVHATPTARINGVVQNSVEFAQHFNCPANSPMNPATKCAVW